MYVKCAKCGEIFDDIPPELLGEATQEELNQIVYICDACSED
jgi:DNA-directed RNA polymerase subunit RPC12/RpoP